MNNKRLISCAITGAIHSPSMSPYLPVTPEQIAQSAIDAANAGAASVHIHARSPRREDYGAPSSDLSYFEEIIDRIRAVNRDVIICLTTGGGWQMTLEERTSVIPRFHPELASMNSGSFNWGMFPIAENPKAVWQSDWERPFFADTKGFIFKNTFGDMEGVLRIFRENGTMPELECYDVGHIYNVKWMMDRGLLTGKPFLQFVTGVLGAIGASPESVFQLKQTADRVLGEGCYHWSAFGAGKMEMSCCTTALLLGGNVRVGMEDNLYLGRGRLAKSNAELVEKIAGIMRALELEPATPAEAREMLGLPARA